MQLIVEGTNYCLDTLWKQVFVNPLPVAYFTAPSVCIYDALQLNDSSYLSNGTISHWHWNFGDGGNDTVKNPLHAYALSGNYPVHLIVDGSTGCVNDTFIGIPIYPKPVANFTLPLYCEQNSSVLHDTSTISLGSVVAWQWNFGDGTANSNLQNPPHTFAIDSSYQIMLVAISDQNCKDTIVKTAVVHPLPVPDFITDTVCFKFPSTFTNLSTIASGTMHYLWNFGDQTFSLLDSVKHYYTAAGNYIAQLTATSNYGCVDSILHPVKVYQLPVANFNCDDSIGCQPLSVNFFDHSQAIEGNLNHWFWDLGDNKSDTLQNPSTIYDHYGTFDVTLIVTTDIGCVDTSNKTNYITVYPKPIAAFHYEPLDPDLLHLWVNFKDDSWNGYSWLYNFGDSDSSTDENPTHIYSTYGFYNVMQLVTSINGCKDTAYRIIEVKNAYTLYIPNAFTPNNDGKNDVFKIFGIGIADFAINIFNRWGQPIFESNEMDHSWDGKHSDNAVSQDVYYYVIKVHDVFKNEHNVTGRVTVLY